jgi:predicted DNA-binding protein (UPF0251 family)
MVMAEKQKKLNPKQKKALELLTCGLGLTFKDIAEQVGVDEKTLWRWRNSPDFAHFQAELSRLNEIRWQAAEDAAREGAISLCREGNQKMIEFVLKNIGYNPTNKVEADVKTDIVINLDDEDG